MKIFIAILVSYVFSSGVACAQNRIYGDVMVTEIAEKQDPHFMDAPAVVLYRNIDYEFGKSLEIHERIKIYTSEGFKYSDWVIPFDEVKWLSASTYNLDNDKRIETKVLKDAVFKEKISEDEEVNKLTFPNIKEGSIIEIKYRVDDLLLFKLFTQDFIPIKYERINIKNGINGKLVVKDNQYVELPLSKVDYNMGSLIVGIDVPPLRDEKFVSNVDNHRGKILLELHGLYQSESWSRVAKNFNEVDWFGEQLQKNDGLYRRDLAAVIGEEKDTLTIVRMLDRYVKDNFEWNNYLSRGTQFVRSVYRKKTGTSGDINLMLVHMLRSLGIDAHPMLVATKSMGWVLFPDEGAFDTVLCAVNVGGKQYLLDGTQKIIQFAQVPIKYVNGSGLIIYPDNSSLLYPVTIENTSKNTRIVNVSLDTYALSVSGSVKNQLTYYYALRFREFFGDLKSDSYQDVLNEIEFLTVENLATKNLENSEIPIALSYDFLFNDYIESINDKLYFEPFLFFGLKKNEFNEEDRLYPIDLEYPFMDTYIINFKIPEGYQIEDLPTPKLVKIEDELGYLKFNILKRGNAIQVSLVLEIAEHLIPANYYPALQALYGEFVKISKSKIVLTKIK